MGEIFFLLIYISNHNMFRTSISQFLVFKCHYHTIINLTRAFSCVFSENLPDRMQIHNGCTCLAYLQCDFSNGRSNCPSKKMQSYTCCICMTFLRCVFSYGSSNSLLVMMQSYTDHICLTLTLWVLRCFFKLAGSAKAKLH